jgi:ABC-2 type transport system ATP-binding protein
MIHVKNMTKAFGGVRAVDGISFDAQPGEVIGLVGPNGAGKTTAMRCICGIIPPDSGEVALAGFDVATMPVEAKSTLAFIPSEPRLFDYLTVKEHLAFYARVYHCGDTAARAAHLLATLELSDKAGEIPGALSRGMKQKLMLACALIHNPKVMIMDEPFTGLDPGAIRTARTTVMDAAKAGATVLVSSHLLAMVEDMVTRVMIIKAGKLIADGTLEELRKKYGATGTGLGLEEVFFSATADGPAAG